MNSDKTTNNGNGNGAEPRGHFHFEIESVIGEIRIRRGLSALNNEVTRYKVGRGEYVDLGSRTRAVITPNGSRYDKLDVYCLPEKQAQAWNFIREIERVLKEPLVSTGKYFPLMVLPVKR